MLEPGKDGKERINDSSQCVRDRLEWGGGGELAGWKGGNVEEKKKGRGEEQRRAMGFLNGADCLGCCRETREKKKKVLWGVKRRLRRLKGAGG